MKELAREFSKLLRSLLTSNEIEEINILNKLAAKGVCHTHDFIDANMVMDKAFENVYGRRVNLQSNTEMQVWCMAWTIASNYNGNIRKIIFGNLN